MKFKKGSFTIQFIDAAPHKFEKRYGWISQCGRYGFHKDGSFWIVSDIWSGMRIHKAKTRAACAGFCENFKGRIAAAKGSEKYRKACIDLRRYLKEVDDE